MIKQGEKSVVSISQFIATILNFLGILAKVGFGWLSVKDNLIFLKKRKRGQKATEVIQIAA
jgi:hypothetical protein